MKYKFTMPDCTIVDSYTRLVIAGGEAEIDETNEALIALAVANGGKPAPAPKAKPKDKEEKKESK